MGEVLGGDVTRLRTDVELMLDAALPAGVPQTLPVMERVAALTSRDFAPLDADARREMVAAIVTARSKVGELQSAIEIAEVEAAFSSAGVVTERVQAAFWASVAEANVTRGAVGEATLFAERARAYAEAAGAVRELYRALTLEALSRSLNGEYALADEISVRARALRDDSGWAQSGPDYILFVADLMIAAAQLDQARMARTVAELRAAPPGVDRMWRTTGAAAEAMLLLMRGSLGEAVAMIMTVTNSSDGVGMIRIVRGFALALHADLLVISGNPQGALNLLEHVQSPPGHALCYEANRAAAHLVMHNDREALRVTDACLKLGGSHALRTLPPVYLRRAIANERLGHEEAADSIFEKAFYLVSQSGSAVPVFTLHSEEVGNLLRRFAMRNPEQIPAVQALAARVTAAPQLRRPHTELPPLTKREHVIAHEIRSDEPLAGIANALHVSPNTLKAQLRSLYAKLEVGSRAEAVTKLEDARFYG